MRWVSLQSMIWAVLLIVSFSIVFEGIQGISRIQQMKKLIKESVPFRHINPEASLKILIIGDSSAIGTGAEHPGTSVAGLFGTDFPEAHIINQGENFLTTPDLAKKLQLEKRERYNLSLVFLGGNDVFQFIPLDKLQRDLPGILQRVESVSDKTLLITPVDIGAAPFFPAFLGWIYSRQNALVYKLFSRIAQESGVFFVTLPTKPFAEHPEQFYAKDSLHPNGEGYRLWYESIRKTLREADVSLE